MFDQLGIPLLEMRCPCCEKTQQIKLRSVEPQLSKCLQCQNYLLVTVAITEKPNNVSISLKISRVAHSDESGKNVSVVKKEAA